MKVHAALEKQLHSVLMSPLDGGQWSA